MKTKIKWILRYTLFSNDYKEYMYSKKIFSTKKRLMSFIYNQLDWCNIKDHFILKTIYLKKEIIKKTYFCITKTGKLRLSWFLSSSEKRMDYKIARDRKSKTGRIFS